MSSISVLDDAGSEGGVNNQPLFMDSKHFIEENVYPVPERGQKVQLVVLGIVLLAGFLAVGHMEREEFIRQGYVTITN